MNRSLIVIALLIVVFVILTPFNACAQSWQQGFDFRNTTNYVTDPPNTTYVLATTSYPTTVNGVTFGWANTSLVKARDRSTTVDPRLAGVNYASDGSPATFYVNLPSAGAYSLSLAMGDESFKECWSPCQVQFLDGSTVVGTVTGSPTVANFDDAVGNNWTAAQWPASNVPLQVNMTGTRLTVVVGASAATGFITPIAFLGVTQVTQPSFALSASPTSVSIVQGSQGTSTITSTLSGGFNSAISMSATGMPTGTTASFSPNPIPAPGSGSTVMTLTVASSTLPGTYPITVTGNGGGVQQSTTVTLIVTAAASFSLSASPTSVSIAQGSQGTSTITSTLSGGFNSAISVSATGMPTGTTAGFSPNPIPAPGSGSTVMTLTVASSTVPGTYPITVTGNGGGVQQSTTVTLVVTAPASFSLSASPTSVSIAQGSQGTSTITSTLSGGFNSAISMSATGMPAGTTAGFSPNPIPAPGSGSTVMTLTVASSTVPGTYPITVTGNGGGVQQSTTVTLTVTGASMWQQGFDFRNTANYVTDPPTSTYVLPTTSYPTTVNGVTFGWANVAFVQARDRSTTVDPRLAGVDYAENGTPATFYVNLPSAGTYNVSLALGDDGYTQCWIQCQIQFLDGSTVVGTVTGGQINQGFFYDATGRSWSAAAWPGSNIPTQVTMTGTRLTVVLGTSAHDGYLTPIAFLGVAQTTVAPNFTISALPTALTVMQGNQGTSTISTAVSGGFNSSISLSSTGAPTGTTVAFNPTTIAAPGSGSSSMTITVGSGTPAGNYPITVTGTGGGTQHSVTVTLTVTAPDFTIAASPTALTLGQGNQGTSTITTTITGGFNSSVGLSATGAPTGASVIFNPTSIAAPGAGTSTMTITVGSSTPTGTYPIVVTGSGGGKQHTVTVNLTVTSSSGWQHGFDFRATSNYVVDPPNDTYVLATTTYPTIVSGVSFGWANISLVQAADRKQTVDPRLAGMNYARNGTPATFYVDLPSAGTYSLNLAMGDAGYSQCGTQCEVQFLDGGTVVGTVTGGPMSFGYFYDATGLVWSPAAWPGSNVPIQVTTSGSRLTVVVGTNNNTGDITPIAFLGLTQISIIPSFTLSVSPTSLSVPQGTQGTATVTTTIASGFNSAVALTATGAPTGTTVTFNPATISAPGNGTSTMTIAVASNTPTGIYPITITGTGGGVREIATVQLTVVVGTQPDFTIAISPGALGVSQGHQGAATVYTSTVRGFNSGISLTASGLPAGATVNFSPGTIPAPGAGNSQMTISVAGNTPLGTYPVVVTGNGGGVQHSATLSLTVTSATWQQQFDFRATATYVTDPPDATYVIPADQYPTTGELVTYGWQTGRLVSSSNRSTTVDPRLAGINFVTNGTPTAFFVELPSPGTYNLSLAMGDAGYTDCWVQCQIQFLDGNRVIGAISKGPLPAGNFYDARGNTWSAAAWPSNNAPLQVTLTGTELTALVGTNTNTGDATAFAYLGVAQVSTAPTFALEAPASISVGQGEYGTMDVSTVLIGAFNGAIGLSATGAPAGVTVAFNPTTLPAPGAGTSIMTVTVPSNTAVGTYTMTVTGSGGGVVQNATVTLTVTAPTQPDFSLTAPTTMGVGVGSQSNAAVLTAITGSFNSAVSLSSSGAPTGITITFNPTAIPAPGAGSSTMTVSASGSTRLGSYPITVTGNGGGKNHSASITLTVSGSGSVNLPVGTGWILLNSDSVFCNASPGTSYFNPAVGNFDALDFLSLCQSGGMVAYSGGAIDTTNDRYFLWTSGHNNYQGNEMYELDLRGADPLVSRITDPAWTVDNTDVPPDCACRGTNNCGQGLWHDGAGNPVASPFSESAFGGPKFESIPAPDGSYGQPSCGYGTLFQPNARETYAGIDYDPTRQKMFSFGGVPAADPTGTGEFSNWSLDLTQNPPKWKRLADSSYAWYTSSIYDSTSGHPTSGEHLVFDENQTLYAYNAATDHYTTLSNALPYIGYNVNTELDPIHHLLVMENGDSYGGYHLALVNLDSCNGTACTATDLSHQTSCQGAMGYWAGIAWDSKRSVMTIFPSSNNCSGSGCTAPFNTAYLLNPDPINPVTITYQGTQHTIPPQQCFAASYGSTVGVDYPPMSFGPGVYSRFKYFPNEDIYLFVQHPSEPVWILRLE